jgi:mannitol/fructose-specific phosphotransferase system IIA component (Ntr-type)
MTTVDLNQLLPPAHVFLDIPAHTREEVLVFVADRLEQAGAVGRAQDLVDLLLDRERMGATVVGDETAIPHCKVPGLGRVVAAFARAPEPVPFDLGDGLARMFFFVLSPAEQPAVHLQVLSRISRLLGEPGVRQALEHATDAAELSAALSRPGLPG